MTGKNPEAELELKKKVLRYLNLSWVLAMTRVSTGLYNEFPTETEYIEKGLATKQEVEEMQVRMGVIYGWTSCQEILIFP